MYVTKINVNIKGILDGRILCFSNLYQALKVAFIFLPKHPVMKSSIKNLFFFTILNLFFFSANSQEIKCVLKGEVIGRESKTLLLHKTTEDARINSIKIPIIDNKFEYRLSIPHSEAYKLVFEDEQQNGIWRPVLFFPENGEINFVLYPMEEFEKNEIKGGELNQIFEDYNLALERLESRFNVLNDSLNGLGKEGEGESATAKALREQIEALYKEAIKWKYSYIKINPTLVAYHLLTEDLLQISDNELINIEDIRGAFIPLSKEYPNHPYTEKVGKMLESHERIRVGGKYIDFSAPDLKGNVVKLSDLMKDKVTLIDLWASWCGPCIKKSISVIPVYEEYKDRGFTVVGVARESDNAEKMEKIIERHKFPWLNLIELNDQNEIWRTYNLSFAGGGTFLVDKDGSILAINPSEEELRSILQKRL